MEPPLFIGSSKESLDIAYALQESLEPVSEATVWDQGIFTLSQPTISSLLKALDNSKFGVFVLSPDDVIKIRGNECQTARDNIIFELGLFIGRLGTKRTFFVLPNDGKDMHLPSDLLGVTPGIFDANRKDGNLLAALGPVSNQIRKAIVALESKRFDAESYDRFRQIHYKARELLITSIVKSKNADDFPNRHELHDLSIYDLSDMAEMAGVTKPTLLTLGINAIGGFLFQPGEKAESWEQKKMDKDLNGLEKTLKTWQKEL